MSNLPSWEEIYCTSLGFIYAAVSNYSTSRPIVSRLPRYAAFGGVGFVLGKLLTKKYERYVVEKELIIIDYIKNHPDDFPDYKPQFYKDVMETWHPVR